MVMGASCSRVDIPDKEVCYERVGGTAKCTTVTSGKSRFIDKDEWAIERIGRLSLSPQDFKDNEFAIEKACALLQGRCDYPEAMRELPIEAERERDHSELLRANP